MASQGEAVPVRNLHRHHAKVNHCAQKVYGDKQKDIYLGSCEWCFVSHRPRGHLRIHASQGVRNNPEVAALANQLAAAITAVAAPAAVDRSNLRFVGNRPAASAAADPGSLDASELSGVIGKPALDGAVNKIMPFMVPS
jgi:hypothetical protein